MAKVKATGLRALDWGDLARTSLVVLALSAALAVADLFDSQTIVSTAEWSVLSITALACWVGFTFARYKIRWQHARTASVGDRSNVSGNFYEQFAYLIVALVVLCAAAFASGSGSILWPWEPDFKQSHQIAIFCAGLLISFLPLLFAFRAHDNHIRDGQYLDCLESDHISDGSIWISVLVAILLSCLAWAAGNKLIDLTGWYGPAVLGVVISCFLMFIFMPYFARLSSRSSRLENTAVAGIAFSVGRLASEIDTWFALRLAPLTGATQKGPIPPHFILLAIFLPLTALGYALNGGWGLLPIGLAFLLAISLGRRWAWVESDRETAMRIQKTRGRGIRIGFSNDLRDEALLGYAFLFVLVPLALRQLEMATTGLFTLDSESSTQQAATLIDWAAFFGTELAKAVPIVDWADIYELENKAALEPAGTSGQHLVFFSRILVDAIIIAALLQAWSILQRNKSQRELFNNGQLDLLDPFAERALFNRELQKHGDDFVVSDHLKEIFESRATVTQEIRGTAVPYDQTRLNELVHSDDPKLKAVAGYVVQKYDLLAGSSRERLGQLRERWDIAAREKWECRAWVRDQRLVFEKLMDEAQDSSNAWQITLVEESCRNLAALLAHVARHQEFINGKRAAYELLGERTTLASVVALAGRLFPTQQDEVPDFVRAALGVEATGHFTREPLQERRAEVVTALGRIYHSGDGAASKLASKILRWVATPSNEAQKPREAAIAALNTAPSAPCDGTCCPTLDSN